METNKHTRTNRLTAKIHPDIQFKSIPLIGNQKEGCPSWHSHNWEPERI